MSDKRTKPCGAESCCYMDDKKHFTELLDALKVIVARFDYDATFHRVYTCREKVEPHEIRQARALIAKHGGGV